MKVINCEQNTPEWLSARLGKVSGSRIAKLIPKSAITKESLTKVLGLTVEEAKKFNKDQLLESASNTQIAQIMADDEDKKDEFYKLIAERLAITIDDENENAMERGHELEEEAAQAFEKETGLKTEVTGIWVSDENENIIISPDRVIADTDNTKALEIKCLASWKHIKAIITKQIPEEYDEQVVQYFIVNEKLKTLFFALYDPRIAVKPLCIIEIQKSDVEGKIERYKAFQNLMLKQVEEQIINLTF